MAAERKALLAGAALLAVLVHPATASIPTAPSVQVRVPAAAAGPTVPLALQGYAYDPRVGRPAYRPPASATYRLDAGVDRLYNCQSGRLNPSVLRDLNGQLNTIDLLGAEPIVILDYMPSCLAATVPGDVRDTRLLPPRSGATWQRVITELVTALGPARRAAGDRPVKYFEAWNEPDGLFWQGTLPQYITDIEVPAGRAVAVVASASHLPMKFSVAATTFPDPAWQLPLLLAANGAHIPVGFVSWHYYANYPALGPDGGEPGENSAVAAAAGHTNPAADPLTFGAGVELMRETARQALGRVPELVLDEWNLSAGGFDLRNDSYVGAAFQAATLIELASARLDRALLYASVDVHRSDQTGKPLPVRHGDWGIVDRNGTRKPAWYAQRLFSRLRGTELPLDAHPMPDVWLAGSRTGSEVHLLAAAFTAHAQPTSSHQLAVQLTGLRPGRHTLTITRIDADHLGNRPGPLQTIFADPEGNSSVAITLRGNAIFAFTLELSVDPG